MHEVLMQMRPVRHRCLGVRCYRLLSLTFRAKLYYSRPLAQGTQYRLVPIALNVTVWKTERKWRSSIACLCLSEDITCSQVPVAANERCDRVQE